MFGRARQSFDLEGEQVVIGRAEGATLVLPMAWVADRHVVISDAGGALGLRIRPGQDGERVLVGGELVPPQGVIVQPKIAPTDESTVTGENLEGGIDVRLQSYRGDRVILTLWRARPPQFNRLRAPTAKQDWTHRPEVWGGVALLLAAVGLGAYLLGANQSGKPRPVATTPAVPAPAAPLPAPAVTQPQADRAEDLLEQAGMALTRGDLVEAERLLDRAREAGASRAVSAALASAIRSERERRETPATSSPAPTATVEVSPPPVATDTSPKLPESPKPAPSTPPPPPQSAPAASVDTERDRLEKQLAEAEAVAGQEKLAGQQTKGTELGKSALKAAKDALRDRVLNLGGRDLTFPDDGSDRVVVVYKDGVYTVRGYADQYNKAGTPVRLFYLARLTPVGTDRWTVKSLDIIR